MRNNGLKLYQANRIKQAELTPVPVWQYLNGSSGLERLCQSGTLGLALNTNCSFVTDIACADARFLFLDRTCSVVPILRGLNLPDNLKDPFRDLRPLTKTLPGLDLQPNLRRGL